MFSELETLLKVLLSDFPIEVMAPIAATAIRAAIRPYSMAVAPLSFLISLKNFLIVLVPSVEAEAPLLVHTGSRPEADDHQMAESS